MVETCQPTTPRISRQSKLLNHFFIKLFVSPLSTILRVHNSAQNDYIRRLWTLRTSGNFELYLVATPGLEGSPALTAPRVEKVPARPSPGARALAASGRVALEHLEGDLDRGVVFGDLAVWADLGRPGLHVGPD